jgi:type III pantothenate kinase
MNKNEGAFLAVDIGNTNVSLCLSDAKGLKQNLRFNFATDVKKTEDDYFLQIFSILNFHSINIKDIEKVVICSVVPSLDRVFNILFNKYFNIKPLFLSSVNVPLKIDLKNPKEVGADRLVDSYGAFLMAGLSANTLVIDFGTATTFNLVDKNGVYLGGTIFPGVLVSLEALKSTTSKLPKISLQQSQSVIGKDTINAINAGVFFGYRAMIGGMVEEFKKTHNPLFVVATGGLSSLICQDMTCINAIEQDLTLNSIKAIGLNILHF